MDFLDFIRKVHKEGKERAFIIKGGKGSGWFAPPKGTHGEGTKSGSEIISAEVREAIRRSVSGILAFGQQTGKEAATALDKNGNPLGKKLAIGSHDSVDLSNVITKEEHVIIHNHPSSSSFSPHDCSLLWTTNAKHLVLVGHDGTLYRLSKTPKMSKLAAAEGDKTAIQRILVNDWKGKNGLLTPGYAEKVEAGILGANEAWKKQSHEVMKDFANSLGLYYERILP